MPLLFPNQETLELAIRSSAIPSDVLVSPAHFRTFDDGTLWIQPSTPIPRKTLTELERLGVRYKRKSPDELRSHVTCWQQIVPMRPLAANEISPQQLLLILRDKEQFAPLVTEIIRLGNDRI